jgi:hypothetical protein
MEDVAHGRTWLMARELFWRSDVRVGGSVGTHMRFTEGGYRDLAHALAAPSVANSLA